MQSFVSHHSAAQLWGIPYYENAIGPEAARAQAESGLKDITVFNRAGAPRDKGIKVHLCRLPLPKGAIVKLGGEPVASPELLFLQFASIMPIQRLILFGLELCAFPSGHPEKALTTKKKIIAFLKKTPGHKGHVQAVRAAQYLADGSGSINESLVYMVLTLPHNLGGFGIRGAVFNYEIVVEDAAARRRFGKDRFYVDVYYVKAKVGVEYQSLSYHWTAEDQGQDMVRASILERQGITVMHMTTIQLYNAGDCERFARNLASRLGRRMQIRSRNFVWMQRQLRIILRTSRSKQEDRNP